MDAREIIIESGGSLTLEEWYYVHIIESLTTNGVLDVQLGGILEAQHSP